MQKGYSQTSYADLEEATGQNKRQLVRDFGSKRTFFGTVLEEFAARAGRLHLERMELAGAKLSDIRRCQNDVLRYIRSETGWFGCLVCNTSRDLPAMAYPEVDAIVQGYLKRIESAYWNCLSSAIAANEIHLSKRDTIRTARMLLGAHVAMLTLARARHGYESIKDVADSAWQSVQSLVTRDA